MAYTQPLITSDVGNFSPYLRLKADETISSRNIAHELLGGGVAVTFGGSALATTTIEMLFTTEAASLDAFTKLNTGHVFQLTDYDKTSLNFYFSVTGSIKREYIGDATDAWLITVDVQEVTP